MFVLGVVLFSHSLLGRLSGRAALSPTVRVFLYASFALFLPLMSYMFSQAKDEATKLQQVSGGGAPLQLPFQAQVILIWMLLVELLRKKVDAILAAMSSSPLRAVHQQQTLWDAIDQIVRIGWIGYLIYSYVHGFRKPGFIILWVLTLIKAAQRVAAVEVAKRSFAVGKNAHLVVGYIAQMMEEEDFRHEEENGAALPRNCWYPVMGEDRLKREVGPDGYRVELPESDEKKDLITVGDIWELAEGSDDKPADRLLTDHPKLKDLCLAFTLFKLLRARLENLHVDEDVVVKNRDLIFRGLRGDDGDHEVDSSSNSDRDGDRREDHAERAFNVIELELNFVMDYYHSVVPVVLCSPWFLVGNYLFVFLIVVNQAIMVLFITGNGRLLPIIGCLARDVFTLSRRAIDLFRCLGHKLLRTIAIAFSSFNILVSLMLFLTFILMEAWEFVVYVLSDWFLVSMLCEYARRPKWQSSRCVRKAFRALLWAKRAGRPRAGMRFNQVCVLDLRRHTPWVIVSKVLQHRFLGMPSVRVPAEVKRAVFGSLAAKTRGEPLSNGVAVLHRRGHQELLWACESRSVTHVILVWHIGTSLFEMRNAAEAAGTRSAEETVATTLSKYCAYLVACAPELLPENQEGSERVYKSVKRALRRALSRKRRRSKAESRLDRVMRIEGIDPDAAANMGAELGKQLLEDCGFDGGNVARGWALLAELWTELVVYTAPSEKVEGHAEALAQGGEFITLLWALATHAGITR
ncbi:hypothetical protein BAE44_0018900 [Dichanthelium oligosanthes]|uniref:DUF4220 domain-containing protein n=1 Tax=Dichanthelium oligosanthes TaxID=888268 RepID=A0A1E5V4P8_9POAL|nr:hypothetical protein BAE44_0018900 [Dichanthelium oligosanthes]